MSRIVRWIAVRPVSAIFALALVLALGIVAYAEWVRDRSEAAHIPEGVEAIFWQQDVFDPPIHSVRLTLWADGRSEILAQTDPFRRAKKLNPGWEVVSMPGGPCYGFRKTNSIPPAKAKEMFAAALAAGIHELKAFDHYYLDGGYTYVGVQINGMEKSVELPRFDDRHQQAMPENYQRFVAVGKILENFDVDPGEAEEGPKTEPDTRDPPELRGHSDDRIQMIFWEHQIRGESGARSRLTLWSDGRSEIIVEPGVLQKNWKPKPGWTIVSTRGAGTNALKKINPFPPSRAKEMFEAAVAAGITQLETFMPLDGLGEATVIGVQIGAKQKEETLPYSMDKYCREAPLDCSQYYAVKKILGDFGTDAADFER